MDDQPNNCSACDNPIPQCSCKKPRVVVCAANRSIVTGKIIAGARHWDSVMRGQVEFLRVDGVKAMPIEWVGAEQGFIDQYGQFLTREEAFEIASKNGQIKYQSDEYSNELYSEDLY